MKDEWQLEMDRMLDVFEHESESSLRKINRRFEVLGRPFNDEFRQYFMKLTAHRLDTSFTKIEVERWDNSQVKNIGRNERKISTDCGTSATASSSEATMNAQLSKNDDDDIHLIVKSENVIEIPDSDDEGDSIKFERSNDTENTVEKNASATMNQKDDCEPIGVETPRKLMVRIPLYRCDLSQVHDRHVMESGNSNGEGSKSSVVIEGLNNQEDQTMDADGEGTEAQNDEDIKPNAPMKDENSRSNDVEFMDGMVDIPLVAFDPTQENDQSSSVNDRIKQQVNRSPVIANQSKRIAYRFKCEHCDSSFKLKSELKRHQPIHANGKFIGLKADSNGLYHCTLCIRQFTEVRNLNRHMKSHKNNQYLYYCAHCMRQFTQKGDKDRHENLCGGRRYECHLCKVFFTPLLDGMEKHMRTHSGAKPFLCMICNQNFTQKYSLCIHLNTVHSRKNS